MVVFDLALELALFIFVGIFTVRAGIVGRDFAGRLTALVMDVVLPCMIVNALGKQEAGGSYGHILVIIAMGALVTCVLTAVGTVVFRLMGKTEMARSVRFSTIFGNFSFVGMPVSESLYGPGGLFIFTVLTLPFRFFYYAMPPFIMDPNRGEREKRSFRDWARLFLPPPIIAIAVGLAMYITGFRLPGFLDNAVSSIASACFPLGMLICGMTMADISVKELFRTWQIWVLVLCKNFISPSITLALMLLLPVDLELKKVLIISSALPAPSLLTTFVLKYCGDGDTSRDSSAAIFATIIVSIATLPMWAAVIEKAIR